MLNRENVLSQITRPWFSFCWLFNQREILKGFCNQQRNFGLKRLHAYQFGKVLFYFICFNM